MAVVRPHPVSGVGGAFGFEADTLRRRFILRMPIEAVVVAAAAEVEKASRGAEKFKRRRSVVVHRIERVSEAGGPGLMFANVVQQVEPVGQLMIAQTARTLFDIGFEMEDGVAVFLVARAGQIGKSVHDAAPLAQRDFGQRLRVCRTW